MSGTTEAFARVKIDALLEDARWNLTDGSSVLFEHTLPDGTQADYVLCDRQGRPMAVLEAKRAGIDSISAQDQGRHYAERLGVPFVFLSNGEEVWFLDRETDAHARRIAGFYSQDDLERRIAARHVRRDLSTVAIDRKIVDRDYQIDCIEALCAELSRGRRKLLVEMATGTGKTRTAAAFVKRLFEAGIITRVLFLVDRIALARQAEDAFTDHLRDYPCHVLRPGRGFDRAKRITVATLQTMIAEHRSLSPGYFDLVITDECHRSIYGKWSGVLRHFDGIQLGLTATPCVAEADAQPDPEDELFVRDTLRFFGLAEPTFRFTLRRAIAEGHLVPYRIYRAMTVKTAAGNGFPVRRDELDWTAMDAATREEFEELFASSDVITVDPRALERTFTIPERNRALVREFRDAHGNGFTGRDGIRRWPAWGKTIAFAVTRRHAETLAEMFDEHFADLKPHPGVRYADFVVSDVGGGPAPDASAIVKRFKDEDYPRILVSVNMLDTGFDCPEAVNLVMARFTRSAILYRQMRGRGTRKAPHIGKTGFTIFDFVGVTDFHGDDDVEIEGGFVRESQPGYRTGEPRMLLTLDVDDHIDPESRDWLTLDETGRIVRTPEHEERAADVGLRFEAWRGEHEDFDAEQARWAALIGSRVRADATSLDAFGGWDFDEHPFAALGGYDQARRVFGGEESLGRLISGFNAAVFGQRPARRRGRNRPRRGSDTGMPMTPELRRGIDRIRDYLFGGGYPNPAQNAEQLSFLIYFPRYEAADAARVRAAGRPGAPPYASVFEGDWTLRDPRNARHPGATTAPRELLRWSSWAHALNGEWLVNWVREEVFPFHAELAANGVTDFMDGARLVIDEPTVLTQVVSQLNDLHLDRVDADTKGDLFEHVLRQIRQAGELGQFRTPRHVIRALVRLVDPRLGETVYDPAAGTAGFLVGAWDHIRLANSSPDGIEEIDAEGKTVRRGLGDMLSRNAVQQLQEATFYGADVDPQMVRLATMNLTLRGLDRVRILRRDALTRSLDRAAKAELGFPAYGFDVILANPPFSGRLDRDRIVEDVKVGRTAQTELLFLQYMLNHLKDGGRCGVVVPEGVLFGSTGAHRELRRKLVENNTVEAVLSLPGGVFNPYSGVKTSVLVFRKGGATGRVLFLHAENDGFKLDANHDQPIEEDDLPGLIEAFRDRDARWAVWLDRDTDADWTEKWWFAEADAIRAADFNLSAGRHRPQNRSKIEHRDPLEILDELRGIETEILGEIDELAKAVREVVPQ